MGATVEELVSEFAAAVTKKLTAVSGTGQPEDQLRAPLESLISGFANLCGVGAENVVAVGEAHLSDLHTRPDYAVQVKGALAGHVEVKAPGKGADPNRFRDRHDVEQWKKLKALPNLVYTDGNEFSLWRDGTPVGKVVRLDGDVTTGGAAVTSAPGLDALFEGFFSWRPTPPGSPRQLAEITARVCGLMRAEVTELLVAGNVELKNLQKEWQTLLFPDATDEMFADGYAQAVTFGLLIARAHQISLAGGVGEAAKKIGESHSLIGAALEVLTHDVEGHETLRTSLDTLVRVIDVVDWADLSGGDADAWLYFYEDFLSVYDKNLRRATGSYYTPPEVVTAMTGLVDEALRSRFNLAGGLAEESVTLVDPAVGTGTFMLGALRSIAQTVKADQGAGAVSAAMSSVLNRLIGFEIQLGPFAVAQLRVLAELASLGVPPGTPPQMFVTDTLANPYVEEEHLGSIYEPIAESRRQANLIKKDRKVLVVIGNPPWKGKSKGEGGWVETGNPDAGVLPPLEAWLPPKEWGVSAGDKKHLHNLSVHFWRWATWKVFDHHGTDSTGVVCLITNDGLVDGPGFGRMREYLRSTANHIWVIHCTPEGIQPKVKDRIFGGVQQPVCIVLAARTHPSDDPAEVKFRSLPRGPRKNKLDDLAGIRLGGDGWLDCPDGPTDPLRPRAADRWATFPRLDELAVWDASGVMPGRTWVIAPDRQSLTERWNTLIAAAKSVKTATSDKSRAERAAHRDELFHPHLRPDGSPGDRHPDKAEKKGLPGHPHGQKIADTSGECPAPVRYSFRSFDRQWIIPDNRLINRPNPKLWLAMSDQQVHLTALSKRPPKSGQPALTATALIPDIDHNSGRAGRVTPLWLDGGATIPNIRPGLVEYLSTRLGVDVDPVDVFAYVAGLTATPAYTRLFEADLASKPGLRVPLTADADLFVGAVSLGRRVLWLHTFGERFVDAEDGRPGGPPRMAEDQRPKVPADGAIPFAPDGMPETISYDPKSLTLHLGGGRVENVTEAMWDYQCGVIGTGRVLMQWFASRGKNRGKPVIGDRRPPSPLERIHSDHWLAEYTSELLNVLNVLGLLVALEPDQEAILSSVLAADLITLAELVEAGALDLPDGYPEDPEAAAAAAADKPQLPLDGLDGRSPST